MTRVLAQFFDSILFLIVDQTVHTKLGSQLLTSFCGNSSVSNGLILSVPEPVVSFCVVWEQTESKRFREAQTCQHLYTHESEPVLFPIEQSQQCVLCQMTAASFSSDLRDYTQGVHRHKTGGARGSGLECGTLWAFTRTFMWRKRTNRKGDKM